MKILKKIGWGLLVLAGILVLTSGIFVYQISPDYEGSIDAAGLSDEVKVHYDSFGIPHIYANNEKDAMRALGYVHAQDRLWQMDLLRRIASGRLSEVFGEKTINTDKFFLALGIQEASKKTISELDMDAKSVELSIAYLDGINQFVNEGPTPIEFYLTGLEKSSFTLLDVQNVLGYMAFSFAQAHKTDPLLTRIRDSLGIEYLKDLPVDIDTASTLIKNHSIQVFDTTQTALFKNVNKTLQSLHIPLFEGSNSWVIGPEKTKNGKVIFANDPHIGFAQPSVWYEAHVVTPTYEKYGYHLAGVPFPVLAHDRKMAYGMTMFENDDVDFYYEEEHPTDSTKYKNGDTWESYQTTQHLIKVKDGEEVNFVSKSTERGPVLTGIMNQIKGNRPVSMWWTFTQNKNEVITALFGMATAGSIEDIKATLPKIHAPGLNIMYGDAEGNIAWWATAKLHKIPDSIHTKFVQESFEAFPADREYLDFTENPQAINPPWHYVYSANNQPDSIAGMLYPGYYLPENRAKRIVQLLEPKNDWDKEAVLGMMTDVTSSVNPGIARNLVKQLDVELLNEKQLAVLDKLNAWQGNYALDNTEGTFYHRWIYRFLKNTFEDELGVEQFNELLSAHLSKRLIAPMARNSNSVWWDDVNTETMETSSEIIQKSFLEAYESLVNEFGEDSEKWTWDKVHTLEHGHPIGDAVASLRSYFNVGPFPVTGTKEVINNLGFGYSEDGFYKVGSGPSTRRVIDFSDLENSMSILPTGQSGNPLSPHYKDQAEMYVNGEYRKMMMNKEEIENTSKSLLTFRPIN